MAGYLLVGLKLGYFTLRLCLVVIRILLPAEGVELFLSADEFYGAVIKQNAAAAWVVVIKGKKLRSANQLGMAGH